MDFTLSEMTPTITLVALHGRLDAAGTERIGARLGEALAQAGRHAAVDLSGVSFIASMGMRLLVGSARALHQRGHRLVLFDAPELVLQALQDAGLDLLMPCVESRDAALARLAG